MKQTPCPYCSKPGVGLQCENPECQRRIAKNRDEPVPESELVGWVPGAHLRRPDEE